MDNPTFVDKENIPLVQDEGYDDYTTDTSRIDADTSFTEPATTEATSILRLKQKLMRDKIVSLYRYLDVTVDPGLADLDRFMIKKNSKTDNIDLIFFDGNNQWQSFTNKRTGEFLAPKTLREKFGGLNTMKNFLGINTPPVLERLISTASKLKSELPTDLQMESIPLKELSSLVEDIQAKTSEASQQTSLDMR